MLSDAVSVVFYVSPWAVFCSIILPNLVACFQRDEVLFVLPVSWNMVWINTHW